MLVFVDGDKQDQETEPFVIYDRTDGHMHFPRHIVLESGTSTWISYEQVGDLHKQEPEMTSRDPPGPRGWKSQNWDLSGRGLEQISPPELPSLLASVVEFKRIISTISFCFGPILCSDLP